MFALFFGAIPTYKVLLYSIEVIQMMSRHMWTCVGAILGGKIQKSTILHPLSFIVATYPELGTMP